MKKFLVSMMLAITALSMVAQATARPLGGGRTFGRQSQNVTRQAAPAVPAPTRAPTAAPAPTAPAPAIAPKPASPWKGILGGALLGLGLGALFSHFGLGGAMGGALGSILMIGLLVMAGVFIFRMLRRTPTSAPSNVSPFPAFNQPAPAAAFNGTPEIGSGLQQPAAFQDSSAAQGTWSVPAEFDAPGFLRQAKSSFIRMQAAWDKADVADLREFTTPEVFAELKLQIQERKGDDFTDVVSIEAELLGVETLATEYMASVKFTGMIKTAPTAAAEPFSEVWNMVKPISGSTGWLLAGIQQLQ
ncbi:MAG: Tim44-like domain-containing protein [Pseudomonadota bacterium]